MNKFSEKHGSGKTLELDESIMTDGYAIPPTDKQSVIDLSQIDFEALKAHFAKGRKHTEAGKLKATVSGKLQQMVQLNKTRVDLLEKFKKLIDDYNKDLLPEYFRKRSARQTYSG